MKKLALLLLAPEMLSACSRAPSINVLGAFFPDWMFCVSGAIVLTILTHHLLLKLNLAERIGSLPFVYLVLTILFSLIGWLIFFQ